MTASWIRHPILAGVIGVLAGALAIALIEWLAHQLLGRADPAKPGAIGPAMFAAVLIAWIVGAGTAAVVGTAWAGGRSRVPGLVAAGVLMAGTVATLMAFPHPAWVVAGAVLAMPAAAWFGMRSRLAAAA